MRKIVFWGCGSRAEEARQLLEGWEIEAVVDNNPSLCGETWHGAPIIPFRRFLSMESPPLLLVTPHFCKGIIE